MGCTNLTTLPNMILSSCKKYSHPYGKAESSHVTEVLDLILGIYFASEKTIGPASTKFLLKGIS